MAMLFRRFLRYVLKEVGLDLFQQLMDFLHSMLFFN